MMYILLNFSLQFLKYILFWNTIALMLFFRLERTVEDASPYHNPILLLPPFSFLLTGYSLLCTTRLSRGFRYTRKNTLENRVCFFFIIQLLQRRL